MKGILYYFSGTGNTKWVADRIKERFEFYGSKLDFSNIEFSSENNDKQELDLKDYEFLIIGTPIHAGCAPKVVMNFVDKLQETKKNTKCIIYSTQGAVSGIAVDAIEKSVALKGYNVIVKASIQMPNNYYFVSGKEPSDKRIDELLNSAANKIKQLVIDFIRENKTKTNTIIIRQILGKISNSLFYKSMPKLSKNIASTNKCEKCGLCLRNCPNGNIIFENGHSIFHSKCTMCLRCIYICPINAIRYNNKKINQTQKDIIKSLDIR